MNDIEVLRNNGVMHVVLNRPKRKNALTVQMYAALSVAMDDAEADPQIKVLLLSGAGGVFSAGNDLDDFLNHPPRSAEAPVFLFVRQLALFSKPVIAAVEGLAVGIGTTMLLHCDLVYAASDCRFVLPFANLGLVPEAASSLLLPRLAGRQRAAEKLMFGDPFGADEAREMGFVNRIFPPGDVLPFARQQAERLAGLPVGSVLGTKALMLHAAPSSTQQAEVLLHMSEEIRRFAERLGGPAMLEAVAAFKEKRAPCFEGLM